MGDFLRAHYQSIVATHLVFVIAWMAGMMYLPRLFVYHHKAAPGGEAERFFQQMERGLLKGIINPSMILVWILGALMLLANPALLSTPWFLVKLTMVLGITTAHGFYASAFKKFALGERPRSERFWRIMNEAPFVMMIVAVVMVIVRPS